jgi:hypothetical protein
MQLQDETVEVNMGPNMTEQGLMSSGIVPQSSMNAQLGGAAPAPGQATDWQMQQDGTYGRVGSQRLDPNLRAMMGMQNYLGNIGQNMAATAAGGRNPSTGTSGGYDFQQYQDPTYGVTEQREGVTKTMPATATYGIDKKNQSIIDKNNASTRMATVKTDQLVSLYPDQAALLKRKVEALGAGIKNTETRTKFIGLNYDLELRKHAAREAYQRAMTAIQGGQLGVAQKNLALREIGMRIKTIIDPTRIISNSGAIIADLSKARAVKGADTATIDKQIARAKQVQQQMMEFRALGTQPTQAITDANYLGNMLADTLGSTPLGQTMGFSSDPYEERMKLLGGLPMQNPWEDPFAMSDEDYEDNQFFYGTSPLSQPATGWMNMNLRGGASPRGASRGVRLNLGP